jgi:glycosyltransferase involved in cell wall biosynthesis
MSVRESPPGKARAGVLVLVPHEPTLDPRVHYTAESLATRYAVTVLAIVQDEERRPEDNRPPDAGYVTVRLPLRARGGSVFMLLRVLRLWWAGRSTGVAPRRHPPGRRGSFKERIVTGPRMTAAVLRFTLRANAVLWRAALAHGRVPTVVYCHDLYSLQTGVLLKQRFGARLVYDSHEYYPYQHPYPGYASVIGTYESILLRHVDVHITVSPQLAAELERTYGVSAIQAIPNVEPVPVPRPPVPLSAMSALAHGRLRLLFQGTFAEGRGLEDVLRAWTEVDGSRAALFLRGPENAWGGQLRRLAEDLGVLGKSVYFLPAVLEKELIAAAQEADVGLIPYPGHWLSYRFACPNKLSQYLHAGLAVLANRLPFVEDVVLRAGAGLCYDGDEPGSFARAVETLAVDRSQLARFRANAVRFAETEFHWARYEGTLLTLVAPS